MKTLLLVYMGVYAVVVVAATLLETLVVPAAERDPFWETLLDVVLLGAGFVGMVLFFREVEDPQVRLLWRFVAPSLVLGQSWLFVRHLRSRAQMITDSEQEWTERHMAWTEAGFLALLLPSLGINLSFAFAGI
jgi:hypothetical protein